MKLESVGILVALKPLNERDALGVIFSYDYGILHGVLKAGLVAKKNKPLIGQVGQVVWNARLDSQLGAFHWEAEKNLSAALMLRKDSLLFMNSAFDLISLLLPERESYEKLYGDTLLLLQELALQDSRQAYLKWEIGLLQELGYALDLSKCSGCGAKENLNFLSPKTGRAVCDNCAKPYINKVYKLPLSLDITLRFLENICLQQGTDIPRSRKFL